MTPAELENRLNMVKYYDCSNRMWQEHIDMAAAAGDASPVPRLMAEVGRDLIKHNNTMKANILKLLDYAASESDKEVLFRYYVKHQDCFDIAEEMFYSYSYINSKKADAFHKLAERLADYPAFAF